jgi:hypothetical protein
MKKIQGVLNLLIINLRFQIPNSFHPLSLILPLIIIADGRAA